MILLFRTTKTWTHIPTIQGKIKKARELWGTKGKGAHWRWAPSVEALGRGDVSSQMPLVNFSGTKKDDLLIKICKGRAPNSFENPLYFFSISANVSIFHEIRG